MACAGAGKEETQSKSSGCPCMTGASARPESDSATCCDTDSSSDSESSSEEVDAAAQEEPMMQQCIALLPARKQRGKARPERKQAPDVHEREKHAEVKKNLAARSISKSSSEL